MCVNYSCISGIKHNVNSHFHTVCLKPLIVYIFYLVKFISCFSLLSLYFFCCVIQLTNKCIHKLGLALPFYPILSLLPSLPHYSTMFIIPFLPIQPGYSVLRSSSPLPVKSQRHHLHECWKLLNRSRWNQADTSWSQVLYSNHWLLA